MTQQETMLYRKWLYTYDHLIGPENDYENPERGRYWKRQLKDCMVSAIGYALGLKMYEDTIAAFPSQLKEGETYERQMEILFNQAQGRREPKLVFEVGSGRGELAAALTLYDVSCVASDLSEDFDEIIAKLKSFWGVEVRHLNIDIIEASKLMLELKPDTVILCETIEHIPEKEFKEAWVNIVAALKETGGLFIVTNWISYHPIEPNNNDHIWRIDNSVYDWLASHAKRTILREGSHLVLQF